MYETSNAAGQAATRPNRHPFAHSFGIAGVALVCVLAILLITSGPPSASGWGYATGALLIPLAVGALIAAMLARRSSREWSWWRYALAVIPIGFVVYLFVTTGQVSGG